MKKTFLLLLACLATVFASCSVMSARKPLLKHKTWVAQYDEFVADVGTSTVTVTLHFPSRTAFVMTTEFVTPPHPAMYMNPDGSVDTLPGFSNLFEEKGSYTYSKGLLTLNREKGTPLKLEWRDGSFVGKDYFGRDLVFTPAVENGGK